MRSFSTGETMLSIKTTTRVTLYPIKRSGWSLEPQSESSSPVECAIGLEIQGDDKHGYHLVMCPEGFSFADDHYETLREAMDSAAELFGVRDDQWTPGP
jgi:hypothetical protein